MSIHVGPLVNRRGTLVPVTRESLIEEERAAGEAAASDFWVDQTQGSLFEEPLIASTARNISKHGVATQHRDELLERVEHLEHILDTFMLKHFKTEIDTFCSQIDNWFNLILNNRNTIEQFMMLIQGTLNSNNFVIPHALLRFIPHTKDYPRFTCIKLYIHSSGDTIENGVDVRLYLDIGYDTVTSPRYYPLIFEQHIPRDVVQQNVTSPFLKFRDLRENIRKFLYHYFSKLVYE